MEGVEDGLKYRGLRRCFIIGTSFLPYTCMLHFGSRIPADLHGAIKSTKPSLSFTLWATLESTEDISFMISGGNPGHTIQQQLHRGPAGTGPDPGYNHTNKGTKTQDRGDTKNKGKVYTSRVEGEGRGATSTGSDPRHYNTR